MIAATVEVEEEEERNEESFDLILRVSPNVRAESSSM